MISLEIQSPLQGASNLLAIICLSASLLSCSGESDKKFERVAINKPNKNYDSVLQVSFGDYKVANESYKGGSIVKIQVKDDSLAYLYYDGYFGMRELGVDLFDVNCSSCHAWYPDFKREKNYYNFDSIMYMHFMSNDETHRRIPLSTLEIIAIGHYLKILGRKS